VAQCWSSSLVRLRRVFAFVVGGDGKTVSSRGREAGVANSMETLHREGAMKGGMQTFARIAEMLDREVVNKALLRNDEAGNALKR